MKIIFEFDEETGEGDMTVDVALDEFGSIGFLDSSMTLSSSPRACTSRRWSGSTIAGLPSRLTI